MNSSSLSFAQFMEKALYDPQHGYYSSGRVDIGKAGDFFTNVSVGKVYGKILALFFEELWEKMGRPQPFTIVEQGANNGRLALDILEAAEASSDFWSEIHYYIVEPFSCHQKTQQEILKNYRNVFWREKLENLPEFEGVHFSNELLDAFPVHLLRWNGEAWLEQRVVIPKESVSAVPYFCTTPLTRIFHKDLLQKPGIMMNTSLESHFNWDSRDTYSSVSQCSSAISHPTSQLPRHDQHEIARFINAMAPKCDNTGTDPFDPFDPFDDPFGEELRAVAEKLPHHLTPGFLWETRLGIAPWLQAIEARMKRGLILIADYGYAGVDRFASYRAEGSIACYENHRRYDNPFENIGKRDITAHVDFTDLAEQALQCHFEMIGYSDQHHFLIGASEAWLRTFEGRPLTTADQKEFRLLQTLLNPETMGRSFKFLGFGKKISTKLSLSGFRYQRPGADYLFGS